MSAFLVSDLHINTIAHYFRTGEHSAMCPSGNGTMFGAMSESIGFEYMSANTAMKFANLLAVNKRYSHEPEESHKTITQGFEKVEPLALIKLIDCLIYQCSEFSETDLSPNAQFCNQTIRILRNEQKNILSKLTNSFKWTI